jgi:glucose/arabinose dehydrogenase
MDSLRTRLFGLTASALLALGAAAAPAGAQGQARATLVTSGLSFPLYATAPAGDARLFVAEEAGRIRVIENGVLLATPFLDIRTKVSTTSEGGLLGIAFPPDYSTSGLFYVYYTDLASDSVLSRFAVSADPNVANPASEEVVLFIDQRDESGFQNHRGGTIQFGPDGFLWFATGDGGGSHDPFQNAQNPQSLLGKMLRIDVDPDCAPYCIPPDNPFVGSAPRDEIWALGLRNPFRWSFDRANGDLWIGDVGQGAREEVDFEPADDPGGRNYGWDVMEGTDCHEPTPTLPCNHPSFTPPVHEYDHSEGNCSIIGGNVYRADFSLLNGLYFFGDYCTGRVWSLNPASGAVVERTAELGSAASAGFTLVGFGEDGFGGLLLVRRSHGTIHRIGPAPPRPPGCGLGPELVVVLALLAALRRARRGLAARGASASL